MTATVGVSFSAGSVAKRILLFTLNVLVLVSVAIIIRSFYSTVRIYTFNLILIIFFLPFFYLSVVGLGLFYSLSLPSQIDARNV